MCVHSIAFNFELIEHNLQIVLSFSLCDISSAPNNRENKTYKVFQR